MTILSTVLGLVFLAAPTEAEIRKAAFEVTAKLEEIPGKPPPNDLYDYAYVMKYRVTGGERDGQELLVAHFNPLQSRRKIDGDMKKWVAGKLRRFKEGALHRLKLTPHLTAIWKNAVEDHYFDVDRKSVRYWCLEVNAAD